ncbi:MAG TPA: hypothetical protein VKT71_12610 [Candidatus Acidoferrales bacterium]|nr:hypothetical protein [Candidatus Acidoferrales bacterium]
MAADASRTITVHPVPAGRPEPTIQELQREYAGARVRAVPQS